ncbi:glycosyltransferase [Rhodoplanes sp. SY1]|uniref:glycosyltransferase n=1 Tax=Rhodoplanes sp. SY1 TaxID=3166646 RepID=UPI0038B5BAC9
MPAYNVEHYIGAAIESILAQSHSNFELLIQDDGSQDGTRAAISDFVARDDRVRLLPNFSKNRGVVAARNALLAAASGEFLAWMDSDDISLPDRLARQLEFLEKHPAVGAVGTAIALADEELYVYDAKFFPKDSERQRRDPYIACQTIMARVSVAQKAGGFRVGGEDGDWLLRIADHAKVTSLDEILYVYRVRNGLAKINAAMIRRLGVVARLAAEERRAGRPDPIDAMRANDTTSAISDLALLRQTALAAETRVEVVSAPIGDAPPLISLLLAVPAGINLGAFERCCRWLSRQNFRNFEVVVAHAPGWRLPDGSRKILNGVQVIECEISPDWPSRRIIADILASTRGSFILWQSANGYSRETRLYMFLLAVLAHPEALAIGTAINVVDEEDVLLSQTFETVPFRNGRFSGHAASFGFRRDALERLLAQDGNLAGPLSLEEILNQLDRQGSIVNVPDIGYYAQYTSGNTVSVLIDVGTDEPRLESCLEALGAQTMTDYEIVASLGPKLSPKMRATAERLLSAGGARIVDTCACATVTDRAHALFDASLGRYVLWHSPGAVSAPQRLETLVTHMATHPGCNAVGSAVIDPSTGKAMVFSREAIGARRFVGFPESFLIRRRVALTIGRLRSALPLDHALQDFLERIAPPGSVQNLGEPLYSPKALRRSVFASSGAPLLRRAASIALFHARNRRRVLRTPQSTPVRAPAAELEPIASSAPGLFEVVLKEVPGAPAVKTAPARIVARCHDNWYDFDEALRYLTPGGSGVVDGVAFVRDETRPADWHVVFNHPGASPARFEVSPDRVLFAVGEPPTMPFRQLQLGQGCGTTVMTSDEELAASRNPARRFVLTPCMTRTWSMRRPLHELARTVVAEKPGRLSWITSNLTMVAGHHRRLRFLEKLRGRMEFDLFGRGFRPIADKWQALAPYRYSIAFENSIERYYFTEKIMDCFVAEAMPIYVGCPNILDFFPAESLVVIDPDDPEVFAQIDEVVNSDLHVRRRDAILESKRRVIEDYNLFSRIARFINAAPASTGLPVPMVVQPIHLDFSDEGKSTPRVDFALEALGGRPAIPKNGAARPCIRKLGDDLAADHPR